MSKSPDNLPIFGLKSPDDKRKVEDLAMPNGGIPINMFLNLKQEDTPVVFCKGSELRVISREEWDKSKGNGKPLLILNSSECLVLERFLRYWLSDHEDGPIFSMKNVDVNYDW